MRGAIDALRVVGGEVLHGGEVETHAEIRELDVTILCGQNVGALEIQVHNRLRVQKCQALENLDDIARNEALW